MWPGITLCPQGDLIDDWHMCLTGLLAGYTLSGLSRPTPRCMPHSSSAGTSGVGKQ